MYKYKTINALFFGVCLVAAAIWGYNQYQLWQNFSPQIH